ncbi:hypothetical protein PybrP1_003129 [[Pythium] brassicae (nom. inval.)]|nr:hypothetical protein PybrP1_003129 [[Pythium] brassicae (nom. inval.)]
MDVVALANVASAQWTQLWSFGSVGDLQQPERRAAHAMVAFRDALYIYGGIGDDGSGTDKEFDDTWKFDLLAREWTQVVPDAGAKPPRRFHHAGVLHSNDTVDELVVFGGLSISNDTSAMLGTAADQLPILQFNDVWRLQLSSDAQTLEWTKDPASNSSGVAAPTPRSEAGAVIYNDQMLIFGGIAYDSNVENAPADNNELWSYNLSSCAWTQLTPVGTARPSKRFSHSVTLMKEADGTAHLVVFSGRRLELSSWTLLADMWIYAIGQNQWIPVSSTSSLARAYTSMVSLSPTWTWFFGGYYKSSQGPNGYVYDDVVSAKLALARLGDSSGGAGATAVIDPDPSRLTPQSHSVANAVVSASVKMYFGVPNTQMPAPLLRYNHRAAGWRDCMVIHGGSYQTQRGDVWIFNVSGAYVREETAAAMPMDVETLVYVLGGFIVSIITVLMILLVRWRRIDRQHRLEQLEITKYRRPPKERDDEPSSAEEICPICLIEFEDDEDVRNLPCRHIFHVPCIDEWFRRNTSCPMCKSDVDLEAEDIDVELPQSPAPPAAGASGSPRTGGAVVIPVPNE